MIAQSAARPSSPLKKGTGSEPGGLNAPEKSIPRGAGPLFQRAASRPAFQGMWKVVVFNWPRYAAAGATVAVASAIVAATPPAHPIDALVAAGAALAVFWSGTSLAASHVIYDRSGLMAWTWLRDRLPFLPQRWVNVHAGLDESSEQLRRLFPSADSLVLDIHDEQTMTEGSIRRAAKRVSSAPSIGADCRALPLESSSRDAAFVLFCAHEIRDIDRRRRFFRELLRIVEPGGRVVLVEHLRDAANFIAFGPGAFHFYSRRHWRRLAIDSGFEIAHESGMTPFVRLFILRRPT